MSCPKERKTSTDANPRHSAYAGSVDDWRRFLSCWNREDLARKGGHAEYLLVRRDPDATRPAIAETAIRDEIRAQEVRLGVKLPRSYIDFLVAYYPTERNLRDLDFLQVSAVDKIGTVAPGWGDEWASSGMDADDATYFRYGTEQVDTVRARYIKTALTIGRHDTDSPSMLVLHPEVLTSDGEMEAEAFHASGSTRTPSFAEMMRYLYMRETRGSQDAISQQRMQGTCADLLPMKGVWWK